MAKHKGVAEFLIDEEYVLPTLRDIAEIPELTREEFTVTKDSDGDLCVAMEFEVEMATGRMQVRTG